MTVRCFTLTVIHNAAQTTTSDPTIHSSAFFMISRRMLAREDARVLERKGDTVRQRDVAAEFERRRRNAPLAVGAARARRGRLPAAHLQNAIGSFALGGEARQALPGREDLQHGCTRFR